MNRKCLNKVISHGVAGVACWFVSGLLEDISDQVAREDDGVIYYCLQVPPTLFPRIDNRNYRLLVYTC